MANARNCIEKYSNIAPYVDGEYAEGFFADIAYIADENPDTFCKVYNYLLPVSKDKLSSVYKKVCLGIEVEKEY
ncbi:hypothetical protein ABS768_10110 [Flavobacterium sp. ST-75]|uniref:Uncharacterized protein n=1 Tax=Flavobacterium rhizophilum TaxID=3163296 RepID=A0ABW8YDB5_9FLAO